MATREAIKRRRKKASDRKKAILGRSPVAATKRLLKMLLFDMAQQLNKCTCYRCNQPILTLEEMSIDHKIGWINSPNPKETFWDLNNITFSHWKCNSLEGLKNAYDKNKMQAQARRIAKERRGFSNNEYSSCPGCKQTLELKFFGIDKRRWHGHNKYCKECIAKQYQRRKQARVKK